MSLENRMPGSPSDWLRYAISDLKLACVARPTEVLLEALCFHAQQAAEKALKSVLVANDIPFPKTHNLRTLLDLLPEDITPPPEVQDAASLTDYAVLSRYPGNLESVTQKEYQEAVSQAEAVVRWAERLIQGGDVP